jgi:hypothetical protein
MKALAYGKASRESGLIRFTLLANLTMAAAFPQTAAAKCPDEPGVMCPDLRFDFPAGQQPVAGRSMVVTARWFNERTAGPVVDEDWLAHRGSPVYLGHGITSRFRMRGRPTASK